MNQGRDDQGPSIFATLPLRQSLCTMGERTLYLSTILPQVAEGKMRNADVLLFLAGNASDRLLCSWLQKFGMEFPSSEAGSGARGSRLGSDACLSYHICIDLFE